MKYFLTQNGLEYLSPQFSPFDNILSAFFTRSGGVSPAPFASLNLSVSAGDDNSNVVQNRNRIFEAIQKAPSSLFDVWQIHCDKVVCTEEPRVANQELEKADAIFTHNPRVTLLMRFADCVPILIYDPVKQVVGIVHAGWQGTVKEIAAKGIQTIKQVYGCNPANIHAVIGPSIGPDHYEVGENVAKRAFDIFPGNDQIIRRRGDKFIFNLWLANQEILVRAGVKNIHQTEICTACHIDQWYSHRAESGKTGRFAAVIALGS